MALFAEKCLHRAGSLCPRTRTPHRGDVNATINRLILLLISALKKHSKISYFSFPSGFYKVAQPAEPQNKVCCLLSIRCPNNSHYGI